MTDEEKHVTEGLPGAEEAQEPHHPQEEAQALQHPQEEAQHPQLGDHDKPDIRDSSDDDNSGDSEASRSTEEDSEEVLARVPQHEEQQQPKSPAALPSQQSPSPVVPTQSPAPGAQQAKSPSAVSVTLTPSPSPGQRGLTPQPPSEVQFPTQEEERIAKASLAQLERDLKINSLLPQTLAPLTKRTQELREVPAPEPLTRTPDNMFFLLKVLPRAASILVHKNDLETPQTTAINSFFHEIVELIARYYDEDIPQLFLLLARITTIQKPLYRMYFPDTKPIFTGCINTFWNKKGYTKVLERLKVNCMIVGLPLLYSIVRMIYKIQNNFRTEYMIQCIRELKPSVMARYGVLAPEEVRAENKKTLTYTIEKISALLDKVQLLSDADFDALSRMCLSVAEKFLLCPVLEKRLAGLTDIKEVVNNSQLPKTHVWTYRNRVGAGGMGTFGGGETQAGATEFRLESAADVGRWLVEAHVVETLFGPSLHVELARRSSELLCFMAQQRLLTHTHLDLVWAACIDKHESVATVMYALVGDVAKWLAPQDRLYLYDKIRRLPTTAYAAQHLFSFVASFCSNNAVDATGTTESVMGLDLFLELMQDESPAPAEIAKQSVDTVEQILHSAAFPLMAGPRQNTIAKCIFNLRDHKSVPQSLMLTMRLLDTAIDSTMRNKKEVQSLSDVICALEEQHHVVSLFCEDLLHWRGQAGAMLCDAGASATPAEQLFEEIVPGTKYTYNEHVQVRFDFIYFIVSNSKLSLSVSNMDFFWKAMILDAQLTQERDLAFMWLRNTLASQSQSTCFNADVPDYIFLSLFPKADFASITPITFGTFSYYFRYVNWQHQKWEQASAAGGAVPPQEQYTGTVKATDLLGIDAMWRVVFEARDSDVGLDAMTLVVKMLKHLAPPLRPSFGRLREEFVQRCMQTLSDSAGTKEHASDATVQLRMRRALDMLKLFLGELEIKTDKSRSHSSRTAGQQVVLDIQYGAEKHKLPIHQSETLLALKKKICEKILPGTEPRMLRVLCSGRDLTKDTDTLVECKVKHTVTIIKWQTPPTIQESSLPQLSPEDEQIQPSTILSQAYFNTLFNLLATVNATIGQQIWDLLNSLPTNQKVLQELCAVAYSDDAEVRWDELLDSRSLYKLQYVLGVVESFLVPRESSEEEKKRAAWRAAFARKGGARHLLRALTVVDFADPSKGSMRRACLASLLRVVNYFFVEKGQFKSDVTSDTDLPRLVSALQRMAYDSAAGCTSLTKNEDGQVVVHSMELVLACVLPSNVTLLEQIFESQNPTIDTWLCKTVLEAESQEIRTAVYTGLVRLCNQFTCSLPRQGRTPRAIVLSKLLDCLPYAKRCPTSCRQFFELLNTLLAGACEGGATDFAPLFTSLVGMLRMHEPSERKSDSKADLLLCGILSLLCTLVAHSQVFKSQAGRNEGVIEEVFHKCLFDLPCCFTGAEQVPPPKCKTKDSRERAFSLLVELCRGCTANLVIVLGLLLSQLSPLLENHSISAAALRYFWNFVPSGSERAACGYVGLKNQGATCYMNSLLQQLFMHTAFRYRLLLAEFPSDTKKEDLLVYHLQRLFSFLQASEKKYLDTMEFCRAIRPSSGEQVNVGVQMDVDEFFAQLFDLLENELKRSSSSENSDLLKEFFGGEVCHQVISRECSHVSERIEQVFNLSLVMQGKPTIEESLAQFVEGDQLTGDNKYFCEKCGAKVDALKRCCLSKLPATLVLHCKRFEFDLEEMRRIKVNDYCKFPMKLNVEPYTKEGLARREKQGQAQTSPPPAQDVSGKAEQQQQQGAAPNKEAEKPMSFYDYELVGVLVHMGTAESGHYYSFIREQSGGAGPRWINFNDTGVDLFDPATIPAQCYGGVEQTTVCEPYAVHAVTKQVPKSNNAYMLFYRKCDVGDRVTPADAADLFHAVPSDIANVVRAENTQFLRDKHTFDPALQQFVSNLFVLAAEEEPEGGNEDDAVLAVRVGVTFLFDTLARSRERCCLAPLCKSLRALLSLTPRGCRWLLAALLAGDHQWVRQLLLECPAEDVRAAVVALVAHALRTLAPLELDDMKNCLPDEKEEQQREKEKEKEEAGQSQSLSQVPSSTGSASPTLAFKLENPLKPRLGVSKSTVYRFLDELLGRLYDLYPHWRNYENYFDLFFQFACMGDYGTTYITTRGVVGQFIDFYLGDESPYAKCSAVRRMRVGDKFTTPNMSALAGLCALMMRHYRERPPPNISEAEYTLIVSQPLLFKMLRENLNPAFLSELFALVCQDNAPLTSAALREIQLSLTKTLEWDTPRPHFPILTALMKLRDSLQHDRIEQIGTSLVNNIDDPTVLSATHSFYCSKYLLEASQELPELREWLWVKRGELVHAMIVSMNASVREHVCTLLQLVTQHRQWLGDRKTEQLHVNLEEQEEKQPENLETQKEQKEKPAEQHVGSGAGIDCGAEEASAREQLFEDAASQLSSVALKQCHTLSDDATMKRGWRFAPYLQLLTWCISTPEPTPAQLGAARRLLCEPLCTLLAKVDANRLDLDENRYEASRLLWLLARADPERTLQRFIARGSLPKLLDHYVCIQPGPEYVKYNLRTTLPFYSVLHAACTVSSDFAATVAFHHNFDWALQSIGLRNGTFAETADVLLRIVRLVAASSPAHPRAQELRVKYANFCASSHLTTSYYFPHVVRFMDLIVQSDQDYVTFCTKQNASNDLVCGFAILRRGFDALLDVPQVRSETALDYLAVLLKVLRFLEADSQAPSPRVTLSESLHNLPVLALDLLSLAAQFRAVEQVLASCFSCLLSIIKIDAKSAAQVVKSLQKASMELYTPLHCGFIANVASCVMKREPQQQPAASAETPDPPLPPEAVILLLQLALVKPESDPLTQLASAVPVVAKHTESHVGLREQLSRFYAESLCRIDDIARLDGLFTFVSRLSPLVADRVSADAKQAAAEALVSQLCERTRALTEGGFGEAKAYARAAELLQTLSRAWALEGGALLRPLEDALRAPGAEAAALAAVADNAAATAAVRAFAQQQQHDDSAKKDDAK
eukprot:TRINITY_DN4786_c0_g2_i4.p1 TRINITY_DN4786_c0_g2~~TRINITY_DN4786_c0_g2_i4.p1  ORF type:complete len:3017 (-),score=891.96 TRINITY_DN4786_c0_g2_i4:79-9129(-)